MYQQIPSIISNIISSFIYDIGQKSSRSFFHLERHSRKKLEKEINKKLNLKLEDFCKSHEDYSFLDTDWFYNYLKYQQTVRRICEYVLQRDYSSEEMTLHRFIGVLVGDTKAAAIRARRQFQSWDESAARELYQILIEEVHVIMQERMTLDDRYRLSAEWQLMTERTATNEEQMKRFQEAADSSAHLFYEKIYDYPEPHIGRYCCNQETVFWKDKYDTFSDRYQLTEICQEHPYVVLLGEAGNGKTTELQWVAAFYSERKDLPRPLRLSLRTYINETLEELAGKEGFSIAQKEDLFFIIDGFDEISGACRQCFLKQMEVYRNKNPKARFLVSSRNNFYRDGILGDYFEAVWLEPLRWNDAIEFVAKRGIEVEVFTGEIAQRKMEDLLLIPFYLLELCGIYLESGMIPERAALMGKLIERKFAEDVKKFRMAGTRDLAELQRQMSGLLKRLAVAMYAMDVRVLSDEVYQKLPLLPEERELIKYSGIWKHMGESWQFVHNNFGEYLAAEYLAECSLDKIKEYVSAGHPELGIRSNWHHVLSYLLPITREDVLEWLLEQDFTLFFDFDSNRLPQHIRIRIFEREWERLKTQRTWLSHQRYRIEDFTRFGMSYTTVDLLLREISVPLDVIAMQNALMALGKCPLLYGREDEVRQALLDVCRKPQENNGVYQHALLSLLELQLMDGHALKEMIRCFFEDRSSEVRYALYTCIRVLDKADQYIDFLILGMQYIYECRKTGKTRLGNESYELHAALMTVKTSKAAEKVLQRLAEQKKYCHVYKIEDVVGHLVQVQISFYRAVNDCSWQRMAQFYETILRYAGDAIENHILSYFEQTGTKTDLFWRELEAVMGKRCSWVVLSRLLDETVSKWILDQYEKNRMDDEYVKCCIDIMNIHNVVFSDLVALYQRRTGEILNIRQAADYQEIQKTGSIRYQRAILYKKEYLKLIQELLLLYGVEDLTKEELINSDYSELEYRYDLQEVENDYYRTSNNLTLREWKNSLENCGWLAFQMFLLRQWIENHTDEAISEEMLCVVRQCYNENIDMAEIQGAIVWKSDNRFIVRSQCAGALLYFAYRLGFPVSKKTAEEILLSVGLLSGTQTKELLERCLSGEELKSLVLHNVQIGGLKGDVLNLHIEYCEKFHLEQCGEQIRRIAVDMERSEWVRRSAIQYFCKIIGAEATIKVLLPELDGDLFLYAVSLVREVQPIGLCDLLWEYSLKSGEYKMSCYAHLIWLQDIRGLIEYRKLLEKERAVREYTCTIETIDSVHHIRDQKLWSELLKIVDLWLQEDFQDTEFGELAQALGKAMAGIAKTGDAGYRYMNDFLKEKRKLAIKPSWKIIQVIRWQEQVQESYKEGVQRTWEVEEVKRRFWGNHV